MNDNDFGILLKWNSNADVLYYSEGEDVESYNLEDIQGIYGNTSQSAFCFIIEYKGFPIGECWFQKMNYEHIINKYPNLDLRRIDIMIGEVDYWNKGIGTEVIKTLIDFGFNNQQADMIFYIALDHNPRSIHVAEKIGFTLIEKIPYERKKFNYEYIMAMKNDKIKILYSKDALKFLSKQPKKTVMRIREAIAKLAHNPPEGDIAVMQGYTDGRKRLRVGSFRIIFNYKKEKSLEVLLILDIGSRGDIYK